MPQGINAIRQSHGDYICIIDQDDVISSNYVSYLYRLCDENNADIALTPNVDKLFKMHHKDNGEDKVKIVSGEDAVEMMLYHKIVISPWNKIFNSKLIKDNDVVFNTKFFNGEGFAFSIECYLHAKRIAIGQRKLYHYRVGDSETGASKFKKEYILSSLGAQEYIKSCLPQNSERIEEAWEYSNWHTHCDCLNIMIGCKAQKYYCEMYSKLFNYCQHNAGIAITAPVSLQQILRGVLFRINPFMASKVINMFRIRKFKQYGG